MKTFCYVVLGTWLLVFGVSERSLVAQGVAIEVTPPRAAPAGSTVTVTWRGPNGPGDFITVVRQGAAPNEYLDYKQTSSGRAPVNPVTLVLPADPGVYEIRYMRGDPRTVLATIRYEVTAVVATVEGPVTVAPGARFEVAWSGPNNGGDWVTIVAVGAAPRAYASYVDARVGRTDGQTNRRVATLQAPTQPGRYELRYVQQGSRVIGTRAIDVTAAPGAPATATLSRPPAPVRQQDAAQPSTTVGATTNDGGSSVSTAPPAGASLITSGAAAGVTLNETMKVCTAAAAPQYSATPGGVSFTLNRPPGTSGYRFSRRDLGELTPTPITDSLYTHAAPLEYQTIYEYGVTGVLSDGRCTTASVRVMPPKPLTPQVSTRVTVTGTTGRVTLSWGAQADRPTAYLVLGAGLPQDGTEVLASLKATGHSLEIGSLPIGIHAWLVTPLWKTPAGTMIDVSTSARVTDRVGSGTGGVVSDSIWDNLSKAVNKYKETQLDVISGLRN